MDYWSILENVLNVIQAITVAFAVITFLYLMFSKFLRGLRRVFAKTGLGFFAKIRVLFICRKSFYDKRLFFEFAILKTRGQFHSSKEWRSIISEFKDFLAKDHDHPMYEIPNCTYLITDEFSNITRRYFDYLKYYYEKKSRFKSSDQNEWIIKIKIKDAYVTPTCLISGLLSEYKENWEEFINRYVSTAYINHDTDDNILTDELYYTFAWLLWGPSFELSFRKYWAGLAQLSYGDESNSVPVVFPHENKNLEKIREILIKNEKIKYGELITPIVSIQNKKPFLLEYSGLANPENRYFYEKIEKNHLPFIANVESFEVSTGFKSNKYYSTAYVWILFELETDDLTIHPENCVAFFEHANLADSSSYHFLVNSLINKAFLHFKNVFMNKQYADRKYRYICSFNSYIDGEFNRIYKQAIKDSKIGKQIKNRLLINPKRTASEVFKEIDNSFYSQSDLNYVEVNLDDNKTISDLGKFYTEIYMDSFPTNERETLDNLLIYLKNGTENKDYKYHITVVKNNNGDIVGGAVYNYFNIIDSGVIEFIVVRKNLQSVGLGSLIYSHILKKLNEDAHKRKTKLNKIYCEIDSPESSAQSIKKYLHFWNKSGYKKINFNYVQPALSNDKQAIDNLWLIVNDMNKKLIYIDGEEVKKFLWCYMKYCMQIEDPCKNTDYIKMKKEIDSLKQLNVDKIIKSN